MLHISLYCSVLQKSQSYTNLIKNLMSIMESQASTIVIRHEYFLHNLILFTDTSEIVYFLMHNKRRNRNFFCGSGCT